MATGRTTKIVKSVFRNTTYSIGGKYDEQHSAKGLVDTTTVDCNRDHRYICVHDIIDICFDSFREIKKRFMGNTKINSFKLRNS